MSEYLSIKEFAEKAGVSTQAVYQRIKKDLKLFIKVKNGKKFIAGTALPIFCDKSINQIASCKSEEPKNNDISTTLADILLNQLATKDRQILEKDKQLAEKDKQIAELTTVLINEQHSAQQAHALHAGTMQQKVIEDRLPKVNFFAKWFKKRGD